MKCRACNHETLQSVIPLGNLPLANALTKNPTQHKTYNLEVMLCTTCGLAQLKDIIPPEELFTEYFYYSSHAQTMLNSAKTLVEKTSQDLNQQSFVVEIASNDGYLLKNYIEKNIPILGIDPAQNIAATANKNGILTLCDFFNDQTAHHVVKNYQKANVIHANNVMAHVPDINNFVKGLKILLDDQGFIVIEVPSFMDLIQTGAFDTIYHEHVFYFSLKPLKELFKKHHLTIFNLEKLSIHGGSFRLFIGHDNKYHEHECIKKIILEEENFGLYNTKIFQDFMDKIVQLKNNLQNKLLNAKQKGKKIAAYGASAKGTTLLNFFNIPNDIIEFVVDKSTFKQGLYTPGKNLLIQHPEELVNKNIDIALLLTWNFKEEILKEQHAFLKSGGEFLIPLPLS